MMAQARLGRPASIHDLAARLIELGYHPVPIEGGSKGPTIAGWDKLHMRVEDVPRYFDERHMVVGCLHDNLACFDIDVYDADLAARIVEEAMRRFPTALERIGQDPKSAIVLRLEDSFKVHGTKKYDRITEDGEIITAQVDVRTTSRQMVVYGKHPATQKPYRWTRGELWATPRADLPALTQEDAQSFRDWCENLLRDWAGVEEKPPATVIDIGFLSRGVSGDRPSEKQFLAALEHVSPSMGHDSGWLECLMGIHDFYAGSARGLDVAKTWSAGDARYTPQEVETKWKSFEVGKGVGYRSVFHHAKQAGADLSAIARMDRPHRDVAPLSAGISDAGATGQAQSGLRILTSDEFAGNPQPPVYIIDGLLQRGFTHSLTGYTGHGKTTMAMHLMLCIAQGKDYCGRECEQGSTLFIAGENPDNVRYQYAAAIAAQGKKASELPCYFLPGHFQMSAAEDELHKQCAEIADLKLIVIDSLQSFFEGESDNSNVEMIQAAQRFRRLAEFLPSKPAVIVIAHPAGKKADKTNLLPRGGSSFTNELDGNFTVWAEPDGTQVLHWEGKHRGPPFDPLHLIMIDCEFDHLVDHKGRKLPLKYTREQLVIEQASAAHKAERRAVEALGLIDANPKTTVRTLAQALAVSSSTAGRVFQELKDEKLIRRHAKKWVLTEGGREVLNDV